MLSQDPTCFLYKLCGDEYSYGPQAIRGCGIQTARQFRGVVAGDGIAIQQTLDNRSFTVRPCSRNNCRFRPIHDSQHPSLPLPLPLQAELLSFDYFNWRRISFKTLEFVGGSRHDPGFGVVFRESRNCAEIPTDFTGPELDAGPGL